MKVAVAQMECQAGNVAANCATMQRLAEQAAAAGCRMVVFPEMADTGYDMKAIVENASTWQSGPLPLLRELASRLGVWIVSGLSEREQGDIFNAVAVVDRRGGLAAGYRKAHLFTLMDEPHFLKRGDRLTVADIEGMRWGVMVCYDIRFPEMARSLALQGAEAFVVPAAWPLSRAHHWCALLGSRAIENQAYVVGANRAGTDDHLQFGGSSRVVDPYGEVPGTAPEAGETLLVAEVSKDRVDEVRASMPVFAERRPDLYRL